MVSHSGLSTVQFRAWHLRLEQMQTYYDFKKQVMRVLATNPNVSGQAIAYVLEEYYGEEVNSGRLYPSLEQLVEDGMVNRGQIDKRTNSYELTEEGMEAVKAEAEAWSEVLA